MNDINENNEKNDINEIISQAPANTSDEVVKETYYDNNKDVVKTLAILWNINITQKKKKRTILDNVRETCDDYDKEMYNVMNKNKKINNNNNDNNNDNNN